MLLGPGGYGREMKAFLGSSARQQVSPLHSAHGDASWCDSAGINLGASQHAQPSLELLSSMGAGAVRTALFPTLHHVGPISAGLGLLSMSPVLPVPPSSSSPPPP